MAKAQVEIMDSKYIDNGAIIAIGTLIILAVLAVQMTGIQNHRDLLAEHPNHDLILLTNDTVDRLELLGRSYDDSAEFYRWSFRDGKVKTYIANDLIDTSYWQVFKGTKGIYYNEKSPLEYAYDSNRAYVVIGIDYFLDSRHTNYVGRVEREIEIYPNKNKETLKFYPKDKNGTKYNLQWVHETDHYRVARNLKGEYKVDLDKLQINWNDSIDKVSAARQYLNGKVKIRYKSAYGDQVIDPIVKIGGTTVTYDMYNGLGGVSYTPQCFPGEVCHLPLSITLSKDFTVTEKTHLTKRFKNKHGVDVTLPTSGINIWSDVNNTIQNWTNETCTDYSEYLYDSGNETWYWNNWTECVGGYYEEINETVKAWIPLELPLSIEKDVPIYIDIYGVKNDTDAIDAFGVILGYTTYEFAWWNSSWDYKKEIQIDGTGLEIPDDYQFEIVVENITGKTNSTFKDSRFTWLNGSTEQVIYYWIEENNTDANATIWLELPEVSNSTNETYYWYYGNDAVESTSNGTATLGAKILHFWTFNADADDKIGTADGTITGTITNTTDRNGNSNSAYDFDGSSGYVLLSDSLFGTTFYPYSITLYFNADDVSSANTLFSNIVKSDGSYSFWHMVGSPDIVRGIHRTSANGFQQASTAFTDTTNWHHYTLTTSATEMKLYIDGDLNNTVSTTNFKDFSINSAIGAGSGVVGSWSSFFNGKMDNVRFYNKTLTQANIDSIYVATEPTYSFGAEQTSNVAPTITANATSPSPLYADNDWLSNATVTDPEQATTMYYTQFYVNGTATGGVYEHNITNNTNTLVATLAEGNFTYGDNLTAEFWAGDGTANTSKANMTETVSSDLVCGTISSSGTYTMGHNLTSYSTCITIDANDIVIDGAGYMINYSTSAGGLGIYNNVGGSNLTIKNLIINEASGPSSVALYIAVVSNVTIDNVNITTVGASAVGIQFTSLNAGSISTISNVSINADNAATIKFNNPQSVNVTSCSFSAPNDEEYRLAGTGTGAYFIENDWTSAKGIYFTDKTFWFQYNNETDGTLWLKTKTSTDTDTLITRTLTNWTQTSMIWNDSASIAITASYNLTGLTASTNHNVTNSTGGSSTTRIIATDATGKITFTIALAQDANTEIKVEKITNVAPTITLNYPSNDSTNASKTINFQFTPTDDSGYTNCSLWTNESGWSEKEANTSAITNNSINTIAETFTSDGSYLWGIKCVDSDVLSNFSASNWTIHINSTLKIEFVSPTETNGTTINVDHTYVNTTITAGVSDNLTAFVDWNYSLIGWWRFDNSTDFLDHSTYTNNGTNNGSTYTASGKYGGARTFDGVDNFVDCGNSSDLNFGTGDFSLEGWFNIIGLDSGKSSSIIAKVETDGYGVEIDTSTGKLLFWIYESAESTNTYNDSNFHHFVATRKDNTLYLYVDKILVDSTVEATQRSTDSIGKLIIGNYEDDYYGSPFNGTIDEIRIHNRSLSTEEINASYNNSAYSLYHNFTDLDVGVYEYTAYVQNPLGDVNQTETRTLTVDLVPTYSDNSTNSTQAGTNILHSLKWEDATGLSGYIFSFDNGTGSFTNDTWIAFSSVLNWSNVTKTVNSTVGTTIRWQVYANDTIDNWAESSIYSYNTISADSCVPPESGNWTLNMSHNCNISGETINLGVDGWLKLIENGSASFIDTILSAVGIEWASDIEARLNMSGTNVTFNWTG